MRLTSTAAATAPVVMEGPVKTSRMASIRAPAHLDTLASIVNSWTIASPLPAAIKPPAWSITDIPPNKGFIANFIFRMQGVITIASVIRSFQGKIA